MNRPPARIDGKHNPAYMNWYRTTQAGKEVMRRYKNKQCEVSKRYQAKKQKASLKVATSKNRRWTKEEDKTLKESVATHTIFEVALMLGRTHAASRARLHNLKKATQP